MIFSKRKLSNPEINRIKSILSKSGRNNINLDKIEAVSNKTGSAIFALFYKNNGREPYDEYFFLIKKKIYFIMADTFWDIKKVKNTKHLNARFHFKDDPGSYKQLVNESIQKETVELSCIANDALRALTDGEYQFYFKHVEEF
ncbi:hypothetical protein JWJ90_21700 [Desulfobulbus rhabdoformis]|uniref:hypothetical protein n=1 Tax=Desulfobulbus rhabdoformis TaxID=34032 RepID=UPI0019654B89|nr:hypothetical protein [Desulfobulbus rhabdoformis]MBM9616881.1 hypothetical protein [Desulfobulbus rhabdoformis]